MALQAIIFMSSFGIGCILAYLWILYKTHKEESNENKPEEPPINYDTVLGHNVKLIMSISDHDTQEKRILQ